MDWWPFQGAARLSPNVNWGRPSKGSAASTMNGGFCVTQMLIHNPTTPSCPSYILCVHVNRWKWQKHQETLVYPGGIPPLQRGLWSPRLSLTKRGRHVCLAQQTKDTLAFSPCASRSHSPLPIPHFYRGSTECRVQLRYRLSGTGVRSKWYREKSEIHTPTSDRTKRLRSKPPSPGSGNGSGRLPLCPAAIWANPREP